MFVPSSDPLRGGASSEASSSSSCSPRSNSLNGNGCVVGQNRTIPSIQVSSENEMGTFETGPNIVLSEQTTADWLARACSVQKDDETSRRPSSVTLKGSTSSLQTCISDSKGKGKAIINEHDTNVSRRPSSTTLKSSSTSIDQKINETAGQTRSRQTNTTPKLCSPGDLPKYTAAQVEDIKDIYKTLREVGFKIPYATFEPEHVPNPVYRSKPQRFIPHLILLAFFCLWQLAVGGILVYRTWGLYVGNSTKWHWTSIHQDLRFDDKMWKLYAASLVSLDAVFVATTFACLIIAGEDWWRDLICLGFFRGVQLIRSVTRKLKDKLVGQDGARGDEESQEKDEDHHTTNWDWDWEERMMYSYRVMIWRCALAVFMIFPLGLLPAFFIIQTQKDKCFAHEKGVGFGY